MSLFTEIKNHEDNNNKDSRLNLNNINRSTRVNK